MRLTILTPSSFTAYRIHLNCAIFQYTANVQFMHFNCMNEEYRYKTECFEVSELSTPQQNKKQCDVSCNV